MFSIFNKQKKKSNNQSIPDHSDSETVDDPGPSTSSSSMCKSEHQSAAYHKIGNENVCSSQNLNLGLGDLENGPYRPILAVSTILVLFYTIILIASKILRVPTILFIYKTQSII